MSSGGTTRQKPLILPAAGYTVSPLPGCSLVAQFQSHTPPHRPQERPSELRVTLQTEGPTFCREGQWVLSASIEGGTPERVELLTNGETTTTLEAPYRHVVDCAAHTEGRFAFVVRAMAGKRDFDTDEVSVTVDRTPPTIVATRPSHRYPSVSSPIAFVFSEPLLPDSLQPEATELRGTNFGRPFPVEHHAVFSNDGTVLELVPTSPFELPSQLAATLLQRSLTDLAGNPLDPNLPDYSLRHFAEYWPFFSVTAPLFPEQFLPLPASFLLESGDTGAVPVVSFPEYDYWTGDYKSVIARWDGQTWQRLPSFRPEQEGSASFIDIQMAARDGVFVAAWREHNAVTGLEQLHVARFTGTGWEHFPVPDDTPARYDGVKMTLAPQGRPVFAVVRRTGAYETEARVLRWTGAEWQWLGGPLSENPAPQTPARHLAIVADATRVVVAWEEKAGNLVLTPSYIHVKTFENGSWVPVGASIPVRDYSSASEIVLALQPDHRVLMAWAERGTTVHTWDGSIIVIPDVIRFSFASMDSSQPTWAPPESINAGSDEDFFPLQLVVGPDLEPWLAWTENNRTIGRFTMSYISRLRATGWEPKQYIGNERLFGFQLDEDGNPWALLGDDVVRPQ